MSSLMDVRVRAYRENVALCEAMGPPGEPTEVVEAPPLPDEEGAGATQPPRPPPPRVAVRVTAQDTLDAAAELAAAGLRPVVLSFADDEVPGGCVWAGGGMQEESLFRRTDYHRHLVPRRHELYPIADGAALLSRGVAVLRAGEGEGLAPLPRAAWFTVDVVACPAVKFPQADERGGLRPGDRARMARKVRAVLAAADRSRDGDALVLGALGCGAYGCPPRDVARVFAEQLSPWLPPRQGRWREVRFAVLGAPCLRAFEEVIHEEWCRPAARA